jgi:carbamoyl-phosphate synthase large subunit
MYSTYETPTHKVDGTVIPAESECHPTDRKKIIILGGGPNRIGQGIEFDYCCCHACFSLSEAGYETIMVNCNPETVSTDYDTSDRLYFEPLTQEDVIELIRAEQQNGEVVGVIVQFGGQTPLKLANALEAHGIPILGTSPDAIDLAEDRERFQELVEQLELKQPPNGIARSLEEAQKIAENIGFPVLIRPSYVLGGRGMEIVYDMGSLNHYMKVAVRVSGDSPVLIDGYLSGAIEVDVDALSDGTDVFIAGIMEHIEEAGVHSGDSCCTLPPYSLDDDIIEEMRRQARELALALNVVGLMNIQFAIKDNEVYLIEVNPRASRTVPFVAKAIGLPVAKIAARLMAGEKLKNFDLTTLACTNEGKSVAIKSPVFPFARFPGVDVLLGPEMKSTGEVMGFDVDFGTAFLKAQLATGSKLPLEGLIYISVKDSDKEEIYPSAKHLIEMGYALGASGGTAKFLMDKGLPVTKINKVSEGRRHSVDYLKDGEIALVINTTEGKQSIRDSYEMRRTALMEGIPYYTTVSGSKAIVRALEILKTGNLEVKSLQAYSI